MKAPKSTHYLRHGELLITIARVAILGAVALPSYQDSIGKGERSIAIANVNNIALALERYYTYNREYSNDFEDLKLAAAATRKYSESEGKYDFYIGIDDDTLLTAAPAADAGQTYWIFANPTASGRDGFILRLTSLGEQARTDDSGTTWVSEFK
jgi:type IV pilus assembly protein PilE